ncbi:SDR family NAD(P)-dependent oxidoreductase [Flammeovirga sp. SJP92]|uniref:SDR family NAD(P)-dependent oxidoreductase n=1 Tax=Flammeovirga sp. SJP92 TaxID=1775430 RepID=UPI000787E81D|nr:SDR family NAD(P)-dependent oxidoreductase [Flammeovirga sp. SJP92]KXX69189.1 hypothetical protein AVL50_16585 [Flammeovirga sp. SJP92]
MAIKTKYFERWVDKVPQATDKVMAITGTTSGIGYWTSVFAIRKNVKALLLLNRASSRAEEAFQKLEEEKKLCGSTTILYKVELDLMSFESVKKAAEQVNELSKELGGLNILANNAGFGPVSDFRTDDGYDAQMQVNHLSHLLLTKSVFPSFDIALENGKEVRICQQSSGVRYMQKTAHEEKFFKKTAKGTLGGDGVNAGNERYHQTKLAAITFALEFSKKLKEKGYDTNQIKSLCAEPGFSETNLVSNSASGNTWLLGHLSKVVIWVMSLFMKRQSAADGALPLSHACFAEDISNGDFIMPNEYHVGTPTKSIAEGKLANGKAENEALGLDVNNQELCWRMSEEVLGDIFEFAKSKELSKN